MFCAFQQHTRLSYSQLKSTSPRLSPQIADPTYSLTVRVACRFSRAKVPQSTLIFFQLPFIPPPPYDAQGIRHHPHPQRGYAQSPINQSRVASAFVYYIDSLDFATRAVAFATAIGFSFGIFLNYRSLNDLPGIITSYITPATSAWPSFNQFND